MPAISDLRIDGYLTQYARRHPFEKLTMAQDKLCRVVPVKEGSGKYHQYGTEMIDAHRTDTLSEKGVMNQIGFDVSKASYSTELRGLWMSVTDHAINNAPPGMNLMAQAALHLMFAMKLRREIRVQNLAVATTNTTTPANDWDHVDATIISDIKAGKNAMKAALLGFKANTILFGDHIADEIVTQADILALLQAVAANPIPTKILDQLSGEDLPPKLFRMNRVTPDAVVNTAGEGATAAVANIWGDDAYLFHVDPSSESLTWCVICERTKFVVVKWRTNNPAGWGIAVQVEDDIIETTAGACHRFIDVT